MNRGFISGLIWGGVAATFSIVVAAQLINERSLSIGQGRTDPVAELDTAPRAPDGEAGSPSADGTMPDRGSEGRRNAAAGQTVREADQTVREAGAQPEASSATETETDALPEVGSGPATAALPEASTAPDVGTPPETQARGDQPLDEGTPAPVSARSQELELAEAPQDAAPEIEASVRAPEAVLPAPDDADVPTPSAMADPAGPPATPGRAAAPQSPGELPRVEPLERPRLAEGSMTNAPGELAAPGTDAADVIALAQTPDAPPLKDADRSAAAPSVPVADQAPEASLPPEGPAAEKRTSQPASPKGDSLAFTAPDAEAQEDAHQAAARPGAIASSTAGSAPVPDAAPLPRLDRTAVQGNIEPPVQPEAARADISAPGVRRLVLDGGAPRGVALRPEGPAPRVVDATGPDGAELQRPRHREDPGAPLAQPAPAEGGALMRYAALPKPEAEGPILSVILLDTGGPLIDIDLPVSIAIDAGQQDAESRASAYRKAGREVVMIPSVPRGATAADVDAALQNSLTLVPEAVALMDDPTGDLQDDRGAMEQILARLDETGHGLVTFPRGLNAVQQDARRAGIPGALVFKEIDGEGQDRAAVKRFLDHAAFRARQRPSVVLFGRNRPETLEALQQWVSGERARSVTLAPISSALSAGS